MASGPLPTEATVPGHEDSPVRGELAFLDNTVNSSSGTIQLRATFANENRWLWPGQFANVVLTLTSQPNAVVVPSQAVQTGQKGEYVFVLKPDQTVEYRPVTVGIAVGDESVIEKGVRPGESVVTDGQLRLSDGGTRENRPAGCRRDAGNAQLEIPNPRHEANSKSETNPETQSINDQNAGADPPPRFESCVSVIGICFGFRISDFEFPRMRWGGRPMSIPELFIRRPVMTTLIMAGILLFGVVAYRLLPVSELPNVDFPTLQVTAALPGASPETMASSVATPLERQFSTIEGLDSMTSTSSLGSTQITLQFSLSRNLDGAALDVMSAISQAQRLLPPEMPSPPFFRKVNPADQPIIYISLSSTILPLSTVDEYAETYMAQRISMVSGVAQVQVFGSQKYAVRVQVNPDVLTSLGIGIDQVQQAIAGGQRQPSRRERWTGLTRPSRSRRRASSPAPRRTGPLIVTYRNGSPVYLRPDRQGHRQRGERQGRQLEERHAGHRAGDPAPAGDQHRPGRRWHQGACCQASAPRSRPRSR